MGMNKNTKYTRDILEEAAVNSLSIAGVLRFLDIKPGGGWHTYISRRLKELNIDTSHFTGQAHNKGGHSSTMKKPEEVLVLRHSGKRTDRAQLKRSLILLGVDEMCSICGILDEYHGRELTLEIDHINGNWLDNRRENLRFLCPNCHSQETLEFIRKSKKAKKIFRCADCDVEIKPYSTRCVQCSNRARVRLTKIHWPSKADVRNMVDSLGYLETGRRLGVSDNAVRKYLNKA